MGVKVFITGVTLWVGGSSAISVVVEATLVWESVEMAKTIISLLKTVQDKGEVHPCTSNLSANQACNTKKKGRQQDNVHVQIPDKKKRSKVGAVHRIKCEKVAAGKDNGGSRSRGDKSKRKEKSRCRVRKKNGSKDNAVCKIVAQGKEKGSCSRVMHHVER